MPRSAKTSKHMDPASAVSIKRKLDPFVNIVGAGLLVLSLESPSVRAPKFQYRITPLPDTYFSRELTFQLIVIVSLLVIDVYFLINSHNL